MVRNYLSLSLFAVLLSASVVAMDTAQPDRDYIKGLAAQAEENKSEVASAETAVVAVVAEQPAVVKIEVAPAAVVAPAVAEQASEVKEEIKHDVVVPAQGKIAAAVSSVKATVSNGASKVKSAVVSTGEKAKNATTKVASSVKSGVVAAKDGIVATPGYVVNGAKNAYVGTKDRAAAMVAYSKLHPIKAFLVATGVTGAVATVFVIVNMLQKKSDEQVVRTADVQATVSYDQLVEIFGAFEAMMSEDEAARSVPCALRSVDTTAMSAELQQLYAELATAYEQGATKEEITSGLQILLLATLTEMGIDPEQFAQQLASVVEQAQIQE